MAWSVKTCQIVVSSSIFWSDCWSIAWAILDHYVSRKAQTGKKAAVLMWHSCYLNLPENLELAVQTSMESVLWITFLYIQTVSTCSINNLFLKLFFKFYFLRQIQKCLFMLFSWSLLQTKKQIQSNTNSHFFSEQLFFYEH